MYMIMFVLDNPDKLNDLLDSWTKLGVRGATIFETTGIHRIKRSAIPMRYLIPTRGEVEEGNLTLFVIVENETVVQDCLRATEEIVGDLNMPNTGIFAAWSLSTVKGLPSYTQE